MKRSILNTKYLNIGYGKKIVQNNLNLTASEGDLICLIGTNGSGKSTLLRTLSALQKPISGDIDIFGQKLHSLTQTQRSTTISLVLTDSIEIDKLSIYDLVAFGRYPYTNWAGKMNPEDQKIVNNALDQVNLLHKKDSYIDHVSDGEKQRAIIAKALAQDTPLVLLDEPTAHLDLPNRIEVMMLLKRLAKETNKTFILSTHELDLAIQISDKIWLFDGNDVHIGIPEDLMVNGTFQNAFGKNSYYFDEQDGHCKVNHIYSGRTMRVDGVQPYRAWVEQSLKRNGISIDENSSDTIVINDKNNYSFNNATFSSIESLLSNL